MSRLIVKNLPKRVKESKLRQLFGAHGTLTDCTLKYTREGLFRRFAFIGYKTEAEAQAAQRFLDRSFLNTDQIEVSIATTVNDEEKPRAWSKYSQDSSAFQRIERNDPAYIEKAKKEYDELKKKERAGRINDLLGDLKDDEGFQEFLKVHDNADKRPIWTNDTIEAGTKSKPLRKDKEEVKLDKTKDVSDVEEDEEQTKSPQKKKKDKSLKKEKNKLSKAKISDMDYLKAKMSKSDLSDDEEEDKINEEHVEEDENQTGRENMDTRDAPSNTQEKRYTVLVKGLKGACGANTIIQFFKPLKVGKIDIKKSENGVNIGFAYVDFFTLKDMEQAQKRSKNFINGKKVIIKKVGEKMVDVEVKKPRPWEIKNFKTTEDEEGIAESGRLFVRNLAYSCTEEEVEEVFKPFGPLAEVSLQVDRLMNKPKGFALVTYMMPEHAVAAYSKLDGSIFQGRMLHIIPGKEKKEFEDADGLTYKKKKELEKKKLAKSSHNWNSLFLGANAVADVMAEKYGTSKGNILDVEGKASLGVRMALGETQIVAETREFLIENGVSLDSFSQANAPRSKTVLLAKNLPAGTKIDELKTLFVKFGNIGRLLLPPSCVTALIEFLEPNDARAAFTRLAYSKFHHLPLYLEWAPVEVFKPSPSPIKESNIETAPSGNKADESAQSSSKKDEAVEDSENEAEEGATLFIKNVNFETTDSDFSAVFEKCGKVVKANIAKKMDVKNPGKQLSMGFGFVQFQQKSSLEKALKELQNVELDGHKLELKRSNRATQNSNIKDRKIQKDKKATTKILVRNIPFEAKVHELSELFKVFGEIKFVRLPKKLSGTGTHRGFGFVDFLSKEDAKRAFNALCHSTHLYGRRLVLEWADTEENIDDLRRKVAEQYYDEPVAKKLKKSTFIEKLERTG
ncbi:probable RNA-binding protein 19 [Patella vulgata]|uniref:probable RNA-binding protein 19 n=1 Tax=Patella vulgata TaxID=6465 RepID=UPI0024A8EFEE|nr:probable RNA-binding protein 19 [Patella vulgata]